MLIDTDKAFPNNLKIPGRPIGIGGFDRTTLEKFNRNQKRSIATNVPSKLRAHADSLEPPRSTLVLPRTA